MCNIVIYTQKVFLSILVYDELVRIRKASIDEAMAAAGVDVDAGELEARREFLMTGKLPRDPGYYAIVQR